MFLRRYKFSLLIVCAILYLSFFTPPQTDLGEITNFDKFVHFSMYFGFTGIIWLEYAFAHGMLGRKHGSTDLRSHGITEMRSNLITESRSNGDAQRLDTAAEDVLRESVNPLIRPSNLPAASLLKLLSFGWLGPIVLSGLIELGQAYLTTNRSGEWLDFLANSLGATAAVLIASIILLLLRRKRIQ